MSSEHTYPLKDGKSRLTLISTSGSDLTVANAARVSLNKHTDVMTDKEVKLIKFLIQSKPPHTSPFEHTQLCFRVKLPIFVIREWHRHRVGWSYNEVSGRYVEFGKDFPIEFYIPPVWRTQSTSNRQASGSDINEFWTIESADRAYTEANEAALAAYNHLISLGIARELARGVLPLSLYTEMYATCNLLSLFHFISLRLHKDAQYEIAAYAKGLMSFAEEYYPVSVAAWRETQKHNPLICPQEGIANVGS